MINNLLLPGKEVNDKLRIYTIQFFIRLHGCISKHLFTMHKGLWLLLGQRIFTVVCGQDVLLKRSFIEGVTLQSIGYGKVNNNGLIRSAFSQDKVPVAASVIVSDKYLLPASTVAYKNSIHRAILSGRLNVTESIFARIASKRSMHYRVDNSLAHSKII